MHFFKKFKFLIPFKIRLMILNLFYKLYLISPFTFVYGIHKNLNTLRIKINLYFLFFPKEKEKYLKEIEFLNKESKNECKYSFVFPYPFVFNYNINDIKVEFDVDKKLYYVMHKGKRLYYSREFKNEIDIRNSYNDIAAEQDVNSPHRYLDNIFKIEPNEIVIDIGAAEGNFSLDVIETAGKIYIFETKPTWIEALNATFEPWKDKVVIINKYVSNINDDNCVTLDSFFHNKTIDFIKIDVEGAEMKILESSSNLIEKNPSMKIAICTYHKKGDAKLIEKTLLRNNFEYTFSDGYMLFIFSKLTPPFFRKVMIKAQKKQNKKLVEYA